MNNFKKDVELYKGYDPSGKKPVEAICTGLGWSRQKSYNVKYFISELMPDELTILDNASAQISYAVISAICIQKKEYKPLLLQNIDRIASADSPFGEIEALINQTKGIDPLSTLADNYWTEVSDYLSDREINRYPFDLKAISFIKNIGTTGYDRLSRRQRDWLMGLLDNDRGRSPDDRFFANDHLIYKGYKEECATIEKYYE